MSAEAPQPTAIEFINLSTNKIAEPLFAHRVDEGHFDVARFSPQRPFLVTRGLSACKGLTFYRASDQFGLLAHISIANDPERLISGLVHEVGGTLRGIDVHLVMGTYESRNSGKDSYWERKWPTLDELIREIQIYSPSRFKVDARTKAGTKSIALNLENGKLHEIDADTEWTWGEQDTVSNKRLSTL